MGSPLRILHVVVNMNRGGAETLLMNLYRNIDRSKVQFDFLTCKPGVFDQEIESMGGIIHRIPYISDVGHFSYQKELNNFFISNSKYQIVHAHLDKMSGMVLSAAKKAGIPVRISHSHNTQSEGKIPAKLYKWFVGCSIKNNASHYMACSKEASRWLFGADFKKGIILKNGVDVNKFTYSEDLRNKKREELKLDQNQVVIGHIGRFNKQKNHSFIIDIFSEVAKLNSKAILVLIGDGPLKKEITNKVKLFGLSDKVLFLGIRSDVHQLINAFDIMLFPSFHEGLPVTLIEAQGTGRPCIISDVISKEVDIGAGLIQYENLDISPNIWAEKILSLKHKVMETNTTDIIRNKGFDIKKSSEWLQAYYLSLVSNTKRKERISV